MINSIHKSKHWQIFILLIGVPIIAQLIMMVIIMSNVSTFPANQEPDPKDFAAIFYIFPIIMLLILAVTVSWNWSVGVGLQKYIPETYRLKTGLYKVCVILPPLILVLSFFGFAFVMDDVLTAADKGHEPTITDLNTFGLFFLFFVVFSILSFVANIYVIYFTAKTFKTAELQQPVAFSDFIGEFFMVWFLFVGIWMIQPKINAITQKNRPEGESTLDGNLI